MAIPRAESLINPDNWLNFSVVVGTATNFSDKCEVNAQEREEESLENL